MTPLEARCAVRLRNDAAALERWAADLLPGPTGAPRLTVRAERHGDLVRGVDVRFDALPVPLRERATGAVAVRALTVLVRLEPDASGPYPFVAPQVRIRLPDLPPGHDPWLGGLHWVEPGGGLPALVARMLQALEGERP
jgi:hypothetical protein